MGTFGAFRKFMMASGVFTILLGAIILFAPGNRDVVEAMVGVMLLSSATVYLLASWLLRQVDSAYHTLLLAAVTLVSGLLILLHPLDTFLTFYTLMAVMFLLEGALMQGLALNRKSYGIKHYPVIMLLGATSLVFAILLWFVMAGSALSAVRILIGANFVTRGALFVLLSVLVKAAAANAVKAGAPSSDAPASAS